MFLFSKEDFGVIWIRVLVSLSLKKGIGGDFGTGYKILFTLNKGFEGDSYYRIRFSLRKKRGRV